MFLSNPVKILRAVCVLSMIFSGCSFWRGNENVGTSFAREVKSEYPFATREPDVFQAKIVIRSGGSERRMFIARDHDRRRVEYDVGTDGHRGVILTDKHYLLFFKPKTYSEQPVVGNGPIAFDTPLLPIVNKRDYSEFEQVGREGSVTEFRARINESVMSEVAIFFDEKIGLPVKQEFYTVDAGERTLQYQFELYEFSTSAGPELFQVPANFRKV